MTSAAVLALLIGSWSCTETFEKVFPTEMRFQNDRTVVTQFRERGRTAPRQTDRQRFAVRDGTVTLSPLDGSPAPTTVYDVRFDGRQWMTLRARSVRLTANAAFMPFPGSDVSVCRAKNP